MNALLLFTGHLKGACQNQVFIQHYDTMCRSVFSSCENLLITYENMFGTVRNTRSYSLQERKQPIDKCLRILKHKISDLKIKIIDEIFDNTTFGIAYPKRYIQMINTIRFVFINLVLLIKFIVTQGGFEPPTLRAEI